MKTLTKFLYNHLFTILLFIFVLAYVNVTYVFLRENTVPPRWDDSYYLEHSEIIFNTLHGYETYNPTYADLTTSHRFNPISLYLHLLGGYHAPLIALVPVPIYFVFGTGFRGVAITLLALIFVFNFVFYRFISEISDKPTALLAVVITSTMPLAAGLSRYFMVEYGLMILVVLWVFLQIKSNHFRDGHLNIWLDIVLGLGMLMKVSFPVYIIGPILWGLKTALVETKFEREKLLNLFRNCFLILLLGILLMGTWYFPNMKQILSFAFNAGFGEAAQDYSLGNPFDMHVLLSYWVGAINIGTSSYYFFVLIILFIMQGIVYVFSKHRSVLRSNDRLNIPIGITLTWFLVPLVVFSFGVNKDSRYLLPILPPIGFVIARLIVHLFYKSNLGKAVIGLLMVFPCFLFGYTTLPLSSNYSLQVGPYLIIAPQIGWSTRPVNEFWPLEQILLRINKDAKKNKLTNGDSPVLVGIVPNYEYFNGNNFGYFSTHHKLPFVLSQFWPVSADDWTAQKEFVISRDYLITKKGDQGASFAYNHELNPLLLHGELPFEKLAHFKLPDGSEGIIYRNTKIGND